MAIRRSGGPPQWKNRAFDLALVAVLAALTYAAKTALAFLPNVELVSLLLCVFSAALGVKRGVAIGVLFSTLTLLDGIAYGLNDWVFLYYFDWTLLPVLALLINRGRNKSLRAAVLTGGFGLFFTLPSYPLKLLMFGKAYLVSYMLADIPFNIVHGAANFIIGLFLFEPLYNVVDKTYRRIRSSRFERKP